MCVAGFTPNAEIHEIQHNLRDHESLRFCAKTQRLRLSTSNKNFNLGDSSQKHTMHVVSHLRFFEFDSYEKITG